MNPHLRPSCEKILESDIVKKRMYKYFPYGPEKNSENILLKTIVVPKNINYLSNKLPGANYIESKKQEKLVEQTTIKS